MKDGIHPKLYNDTVVTCACGSSFVTISTLPSMTVDICSACHPFYTGQQKFVDTEGRIDKFKKKQELASQKRAVAQELKKAKDAKKTPSKSHSTSAQPTLKEMLEIARKNSSKK